MRVSRNEANSNMPYENPMDSSRNSSNGATGENSAQSKAFQASFEKISLEQQKQAPTQQANPQSMVEQKMMTTFKKFCKLVESGTKDALHMRQKTGTLMAPATNSTGRAPMSLRPNAAPSLINHRSVRRTSSGRVRAVGRTACCYMAREGAHKLRITIEARLRADAEDPNPNSSSLFVNGGNSSMNLGESSASLTGSGYIPTFSLEDQAREVKDAISTMVKGMPPLIPGTPIIVIFNAILEHEPESEGPDVQRAFSWKTQVATPDGKERQEERQAELEAAYKAQGVSLATTVPKPQKEKNGNVFSILFGKEKAKSTTSLGSS
ncbi:hypothetical protein HDU67_004809 [Dinochytrium kinnereticum]|nr:hypothetical protein HDU67_004809 [Dinochytrium kinnereticum]